MTERPSPHLTPEDMGINLEEDSPDVTEEEVQLAIHTDGYEDYVRKIVAYIRDTNLSAKVSTSLRRKGGILYCRVVVGNQAQLFYADHLRRNP